MTAVVTAESAKIALFLLIALVPSFVVHEFAHVWAAERMGDASATRFGRRTLRPRPHVDPLGSLILPGLVLLLWAGGLELPVFAYGKLMPLNPMNFRNPRRDTILYSLAGPGVNLLIAVAAAALLRATSSGDPRLFFAAFLNVNISMLVIQLMPVPGLDGSKILEQFLHGRAREIYSNLDQYLPLFMILIYFLLGGIFFTIVRALGNALCGALVGGDCL
jgi:Zn-dependent protease